MRDYRVNNGNLKYVATKNRKEVNDGNEEISMGYDPEGGYRSGFSFGWRFGR